MLPEVLPMFPRWMISITDRIRLHGTEYIRGDRLLFQGTAIGLNWYRCRVISPASAARCRSDVLPGDHGGWLPRWMVSITKRTGSRMPEYLRGDRLLFQGTASA